MDLSTYALTKKIAESAVSGVESMSVDGTTLKINTKDGNELNMVFPTPKDGSNGKSAYTIAVDNGFEGTEVEWLESLKGADGKDGKDSAETNNAQKSEIRFKAVIGITHVGECYSYTQKNLRGTGSQYNCIEYSFDGAEKAVRFSGATTGGSDRLGYCFVDDDLNVISKPEFISGQLFENVVMEIPAGATKIFVNGNGYESPHLEVGVEDKMSDSRYLPQLLGRFGRKLQYKDKFAWKPMPNAYIAFTFDDSLESTSEIADLFIRKGVPCCFGAIPDKLLMGTTAGETILDAMNRVIAIGGEVLAHGNASEIITEENISDENHLYNKFVINHQKYIDFGLTVRGVVRVGGSGNVCGDPRTDEWVRLFYDYGDLYGVNAPYNHTRFSGSSYDDYKKAVDKAIADKSFCPLLFHNSPDWLETLIDYVIEQGAVISNYADVYDTYGSTEDMITIERRLSAVEGSDGNEVKY